MTYPPLRYNVVRVALAKPGTLKEVHHISLASTLLVQAVFVLFETNRTAKNDFVATSRESVVRVVKYDFHWGKCRKHCQKVPEGGMRSGWAYRTPTGLLQQTLLRARVTAALRATWRYRHPKGQTGWLHGYMREELNEGSSRLHSPAKKLLFPDPLRPTTTLCLGENGSICV